MVDSHLREDDIQLLVIPMKMGIYLSSQKKS